MLVEWSNEIKDLALALSKFQSELPPVLLNSVNPFLHNRYSDLAEIIKTAKPFLAKNELAYSQVVMNTESSVSVITLLLHSTGQWISSTMTLPVGEEKGKSLAQVIGSLITYMKRYSLSALLGISSEEDVDGADKKSKASAAAQAEENTPERILAGKILKKLTSLGGSKNEELVKFIKQYEPTGNPNKIKDIEKLKEIYKNLEEWKQ